MSERTQQQPETVTIRCSTCGGDGWVIDHIQECYDAQECVGCEGEQVICDVCGGSGVKAVERLP